MQDTVVVPPPYLPVDEEPFALSEVAEVGRSINSSWQKAAAQVLETAQLCERAFRRYGSRGLPVLLRAAQMSKATFMKLVAIGRDERLRRVKDLLPPGFSIIYAMSQLGDEAFNDAVKVGVIHPHARRAEIEALRKPLGSRGGPVPDSGLPTAIREMAPGGRLQVVVPDHIDVDACTQMRRVLHRLQTKFGVKIVSIKNLDSSSEAVATSASSSATSSSPVNPPPPATQAFAPSKLPKPGASPSAKQSS
jgi:hypothetical protein